MNRTGVLRCGTAAVLFGISAPLASLLADDMAAFTLAGLLYIGAAIAVIPLRLSQRAKPRHAGRRAGRGDATGRSGMLHAGLGPHDAEMATHVSDGKHTFVPYFVPYVGQH